MPKIKRAVVFSFKTLVRTVQWVFIGVVLLEVLSFLALITSHYFVYGRLRDYNYAYYDPYTVFKYRDGRRPTLNNSVSPDPELNRRIWLFGGSTMRGHTDYDDRTIPSLMAAKS